MLRWSLKRLIEIASHKKEDPSEWFKSNLEAKLCNGPVPKCGECVFRDTVMCRKVTCSYTNKLGDAETVYWAPRATNPNNLVTSQKLVDYVNTVSVLKIIDDSKAIVDRAVLENRR
jgi:hypothetical protein